jgi:hypothetical protein
VQDITSPAPLHENNVACLHLVEIPNWRKGNLLPILENPSHRGKVTAVTESVRAGYSLFELGNQRIFMFCHCALTYLQPPKLFSPHDCFILTDGGWQERLV